MNIELLKLLAKRINPALTIDPIPTGSGYYKVYIDATIKKEVGYFLVRIVEENLVRYSEFKEFFEECYKFYTGEIREMPSWCYRTVKICKYRKLTFKNEDPIELFF